MRMMRGIWMLSEEMMMMSKYYLIIFGGGNWLCIESRRYQL